MLKPEQVIICRNDPNLWNPNDFDGWQIRIFIHGLWFTADIKNRQYAEKICKCNGWDYIVKT